jgi:hypothetical protein
MYCFAHRNNSALGTCKACNKAVCAECLIDTGNGLACCLQCEQEVKDIHAIVSRSKLIYSIGTKGSALPSGILVYIFFTILFLGWGIFEYITKNRTNEFIIMMGLGFGVLTIIMYRRIKKLNLNC